MAHIPLASHTPPPLPASVLRSSLMEQEVLDIRKFLLCSAGTFGSCLRVPDRALVPRVLPPSARLELPRGGAKPYKLPRGGAACQPTAPCPPAPSASGSEFVPFCYIDLILSFLLYKDRAMESRVRGLGLITRV